MAKFFGNLHLVLVAGLVFAIAVMMHFGEAVTVDTNSVFRWLHVFFGILWIGLLYYFNFVQIPTLPKIPAELKPGVSKHIAPAALFWFRWAALATVLLGVAIAGLAKYLMPALGLQDPYKLVGVGIIMYAPRPV